MWRIVKWVLWGAPGSLGGVIALDSQDVLDLTHYPIFRAIRTGITTASIILDYKWSLYKLEVDSKEYETAKSQTHSRSAKKMLTLCWRNRGTYIKVGQHLGGMDYLLPPEYTKVLKVLHSQAPQSTMQEIEQVVKEDLKVKSLDEIFTDFEETPLGTASLAQVHRAKLRRDGSRVAVKVQHPSVRDLAHKDMNMMDRALRCVKQVFPDFNLMWLGEETRRNLPIELDFTMEVKNCEEASANLKCFSWVKLPKVYHKYSTDRVLVMEYFEGGQVNDKSYFKEHSINFNRVSRLLGKLFSEMIFVHGFVHCDPHPGNILVRWRPKKQTSLLQKVWSFFSKDFGEDLELVLLDHGLYRRLTKEFRYNYAGLWQAIINTDVKDMEKYARAIGGGDLYPILVTIVTGRAWKVVGQDGIKKVKFSKQEDDAIRSGVGGFLPDISQVLSNVPSDMLLVLKTNDHLRGLEYAYGVRGHASGFLDMSRCCLRALRDLKLEMAPSSQRNIIFRIQCHLRLLVDLAKISLYELFLWVRF
ncbi:unnamed protein product [Clavelina lepadiformis]|uniref:AarF domain-containing protein kinase 1 n=1 Tax=Clavelina lepadiformis TaxID=159417 RepID=A0ABP0FTG9_CLALP